MRYAWCWVDGTRLAVQQAHVGQKADSTWQADLPAQVTTQLPMNYFTKNNNKKSAKNTKNWHLPNLKFAFGKTLQVYIL